MDGDGWVDCVEVVQRVHVHQAFWEKLRECLGPVEEDVGPYFQLCRGRKDETCEEVVHEAYRAPISHM